jgi:hypothetical protein
MERVYLSSTVQDLKDYRESVTNVLRKCGFDVEAMEKHPARDERPKAACEADAAGCDLYVGVFAWRYGYVPTDDNPERKSITELEYLAAEKAGRPRFVFLLDDNAPWPPSLLDSQGESGGKQISELRNRLKTERWAGFFKSPDDLANQVLTTAIQYRSTKRVAFLSEIQDINDAKEFGPSYYPNIQKQIDQPASEFVALRLGPVPWWDTRLHLTAALTSDFTEIRQFVLLDAESKFLVMAAPAEIRRALAKSSPHLEALYSSSRMKAANLGPNEAGSVIALYPDAVTSIFQGQTEEQVKRVITPAFVRELGIRAEGEPVDVFGNERWSNSDIVRRRSPYVVVIRDGKLDGVIDRADVVSQIAASCYQNERPNNFQELGLDTEANPDGQVRSPNAQLLPICWRQTTT